jgi:PPOX class probable F420-dependent enzyme
VTATELDRHRYVSLATFRRNGTEVATPVWFAAVDGKLYVISAGDAGKVKRLRHSPRARVAPCDARGGSLGEWQDATAQIISDPGLIERSRAALRAKYGWQIRVLDFFSRLTGRSRRRGWIQIVLLASPRA